MTSEIEFSPFTRTFSTGHTAHSAHVKLTSLRGSSSAMLPACAAWEFAGYDTEFESPGSDASTSDLSQSDAEVKVDTYHGFIFVRHEGEDEEGSGDELVEADE